jgi:hypothetical protein
MSITRTTLRIKIVVEGKQGTSLAHAGFSGV